MPSASTVIGRYQVVDRLGQGGMGTLYLATDPALERLVAIKVLRGDFDDQDLRERFAREARSISRLRHPNIVTIFEYGDHNGQPFIVMEYISGESMAEMIGRRADMAFSRKLQMIEELCAGMAYAHRSKIVHRDIKPANIMLDEESGLVKVLDFGIARDLDSSLTRFTQVVGTPSYMSPEQASGKPLDHRSDIFSIGSVFYELLSFRQAFDGQSPFEVMDRIAKSEPPPLAEVCRGVGPAIVSIVKRALQKDPADRYQDLEAMRADIFRARDSAQSNSDATISMPSPRVPQATPQPSNQLEKRRASQIKMHLDAATAAFEHADYDAAIESCEQVLLLDASNTRAPALIDRVRAAQQQRLIDDHLERARGHLAEGSLTEAEDALAEALKQRSAEPAAVALQRELQIARREQERARQRAAAAEVALERARVSLEEGAFESAIRAAGEVLAYTPHSIEARTLKERALAGLEARRQAKELDRRASDVVRSARELFAQGNHADAVALLEDFAPPHPVIDEGLFGLRSELETFAARQRAEQAERHRREEEERSRRQLDEERRKQISALVAKARQRADAADYDAALDALSAAERLDPATPDLPGLRALVTAGRVEAEAAATRRLQISAELNTAARLLDAGQFEEALARADGALALDPDDAEARALRTRVQTSLDDQRRRIEEDHQRAEEQRTIEAAAERTRQAAAERQRIEEEERRAEEQRKFEVAAARARLEAAERRRIEEEQRRRNEERLRVEEAEAERARSIEARRRAEADPARADEVANNAIPAATPAMPPEVQTQAAPSNVLVPPARGSRFHHWALGAMATGAAVLLAVLVSRKAPEAPAEMRAPEAGVVDLSARRTEYPRIAVPGGRPARVIPRPTPEATVAAAPPPTAAQPPVRTSAAPVNSSPAAPPPISAPSEAPRSEPTRTISAPPPEATRPAPAPPAPAPPRVSPPVLDPAVIRARDEVEIRGLVEAYRSAYERRDVAAVGRLVHMPEKTQRDLAKTLQGYSNYQVAIQPDTISFRPDGQTASVRVQITQTFRAVGGNQVTRAVGTFTFSKTSGVWAIADLTFAGR